MKKLFTSVAFMLIMLMSITMTAFAADINIPSTDAKAVEDIITKLNTDKRLDVELKPNATTQDTKLIKVNGTKITFNEEAFNEATEKSKKAALKAFVKELQNSSVSEQSQQKIIDDMSLADSNVSRMLIPLVMDSTSADIYTAMRWLGPILPIVRVIFGVGAICISLFLIGSTIVDLCFIGLPIAREGLQNRGENKGGGRVPFVSSDAVSVIKETESSLDSSGGYKNAYLVYFKRRVLTYIILSICLLYLVVGELGGLIAWILSLGDGVVGGS